MKDESGFGFCIYSRDADSLDGFKKLIREIDASLFDHLWFVDFLDRDVYANLTLAALNSSNIKIGSAVTNPFTRHPYVTAQAFATIDEISGGRALLGFGTGGVDYLLRPLGLTCEDYIKACRESVQIIRSLLTGDAVFFTGSLFKTNGAQLGFKPVRDSIPLFFAASGARMLELAAELADDIIILVGSDPAFIEYAKDYVRIGSERCGKSLDSMRLVCWLYCAVGETKEDARRAVEHQVVFAPVSVKLELLKSLGCDTKNIEKIRKAFKNGDRALAARLMPEDLVDKSALVESSARCVDSFCEKIAAIRRTGVKRVIITPVPGQDKRGVLELFNDKIIPSL